LINNLKTSSARFWTETIPGIFMKKEKKGKSGLPKQEL